MNSDKYKYKRLIPYIIAFLLFVSTLFISIQLITYYQLNVDEGIPIYSAKRILDGQVLYRDFFDFVPPLTDYIVALAYWLFGSTLKVARLTVVIANALGVVMLWFISFRIVKKKWLAIMPAVIMVGYAGNYYYVSHHWFVLDGIILTLFIIIRCIEDKYQGNLKWMLPGMATAVVFLIMQSTGLALFGMLFVFIALLFRYRRDSYKNIIKSTGYFTIGFLVPVFIVLFYFYYVGALNPMLYDLFIWPWEHYTIVNNASISYLSQIFYYPSIYHNWEFLMHIFADYIFVFIAIITSFLYFIKVFEPKQAITIYDKNIMALTVVLIAAFASLMVSPVWRNYLILSPLSALLLILLIEYSYINNRLIKGLLYACLFIFSFAILYNATDHYLYENSFMHSSYVFKKKTNAGEVIFLNLSSEYLKKEIPIDLDPLPLMKEFHWQFPKDMFIIYWTPMFYFLSGSNDPTILNTFIPCYNTQEQEKTVIRQLEQAKPPFIIIDESMVTLLNRKINPCVFDSAHDMLLQWIIGHYKFRRLIPVYAIYVRSK